MGIAFLLVLVVVALALGAVALGLVRDVRGRTLTLTDQLDALKRDVDQLHQELEKAHGELNTLKATADVVSPPPLLPRTRPAGLDDLRQRLRAAHTEEDSAEE